MKYEYTSLHLTSSADVIKNIQAIFKEQGIPEILYVDNSLQCANREFAKFSMKYSFLHKIYPV